MDGVAEDGGLGGTEGLAGTVLLLTSADGIPDDEILEGAGELLGGAFASLLDLFTVSIVDKSLSSDIFVPHNMD